MATKRGHRRRRRLNNKDVILSKCNAPDAYLNKPDDQAVWCSDDGNSYAIAFYKGPRGSSSVSPFSDSVFTVKPDALTFSGGIRGDAPKGKYRYRVIGDSGCDHDPVFHIGP